MVHPFPKARDSLGLCRERPRIHDRTKRGRHPEGAGTALPREKTTTGGASDRAGGEVIGGARLPRIRLLNEASDIHHQSGVRGFSLFHRTVLREPRPTKLCHQPTSPTNHQLPITSHEAPTL